MTGLWQVSGRSDIHSMAERIRIDLDYIDRWSLGLDARICLRTVAAVLSGRGAQ
ncbi:MAG: Bacterial sugar transferase [Lentisphaerae bacterium ADurb.BinA184]|nr:MAG: Bacterial sugar transferase [Lentisphaerae bacterium ADurb.BinA184]